MTAGFSSCCCSPTSARRCSLYPRPRSMASRTPPPGPVTGANEHVIRSPGLARITVAQPGPPSRAALRRLEPGFCGGGRAGADELVRVDVEQPEGDQLVTFGSEDVGADRLGQLLMEQRDAGRHGGDEGGSDPAVDGGGVRAGLLRPGPPPPR